MEDSQDQAEQLFATLVGLDPSAREAYLEEIGRTSPSLRLRVEQLLRDDKLAGSFMNRPLLDPAQTPTVTHLSTSGDEPHGPVNVYLPQFHPGDVIADRYVVARFIAKGGMGEVYEVEDKHLRGVHVALKTILSHFATDPMMHERFKREVLTAREISHPNVCAVYDLLEWDRGEGRLLFLTMKLLPGETLLTRLAREGRRPQAELAAITRQVGSGLAAAHAAGVLHRDIKSANIMLNGTGASVFAWITDFGLARSMVQEGTALTVHGIPGTPGYVAPELFYGDPPSRASDVFAFGVVLYEMITGKLPRGSITDPQCKKELQTGEMTGPWRRMVEGCLQPAPELRCQDIESALKMVPGLAASSTHTVPWTSGGTLTTFSRRHLLGMTGAAAVVAAASGAWLEWDGLLNLFEPLPMQRSVALMAWPLNGPAALVTTILDEIGQRLRRAEVHAKNLLVFSIADTQSSQIPIQLPQDAGKALSATLVLAASMQMASNANYLYLKLLDVGTQGVLRSTSVKFDTKDIGTIAEKASRAVMRMFGLPQHDAPLQDAEELSRVSPAVFEVFSQAQTAEGEPNNAGLEKAILLFQKAVEMDPHFALGYAELAIAYVLRFNGGGDAANIALADGNSKLALRYNPASTRALLSVALAKVYSGDPKQSMDYFARALKSDPDNPQVQLYRAQAFRFMSADDNAANVYREIIAKRPNYWPAYDELGFLLSRVGKHKEAVEEFKKAKAVAPQAALPQANLGSEYVFLGLFKEAKEECRKSIEKSPTDPAYQTLGNFAFMDKDYRLARSMYQAAANLNPRNDDNWRDIADCEAMLGNEAGVKQNYRKAANALGEIIAGHRAPASEWATLAFYLAKVGDRAQAESALQRVPADVPDLNTQLMMIQAMDLLGRKEEALKLLLRALDHGLSPMQVDFALDLKNLKNEPNYVSRVAKLKEQGSLPIT